MHLCLSFSHSGFITGPKLDCRIDGPIRPNPCCNLLESIDTSKDSGHYSGTYARATAMAFYDDKVPILGVIWENGIVTANALDDSIAL